MGAFLRVVLRAKEGQVRGDDPAVLGHPVHGAPVDVEGVLALDLLQQLTQLEREVGDGLEVFVVPGDVQLALVEVHQVLVVPALLVELGELAGGLLVLRVLVEDGLEHVDRVELATLGAHQPLGELHPGRVAVRRIEQSVDQRGHEVVQPIGVVLPAVHLQERSPDRLVHRVRLEEPLVHLGRDVEVTPGAGGHLGEAQLELPLLVFVLRGLDDLLHQLHRPLGVALLEAARGQGFQGPAACGRAFVGGLGDLDRAAEQRVQSLRLDRVGDRGELFALLARPRLGFGARHQGARLLHRLTDLGKRRLHAEGAPLEETEQEVVVVRVAGDLLVEAHRVDVTRRGRAVRRAGLLTVARGRTNGTRRAAHGHVEVLGQLGVTRIGVEGLASDGDRLLEGGGVPEEDAGQLVQCVGARLLLQACHADELTEHPALEPLVVPGGAHTGQRDPRGDRLVGHRLGAPVEGGRGVEIAPRLAELTEANQEPRLELGVLVPAETLDELLQRGTVALGVVALVDHALDGVMDGRLGRIGLDGLEAPCERVLRTTEGFEVLTHERE